MLIVQDAIIDLENIGFESDEFLLASNNYCGGCDDCSDDFEPCTR